MANEDKVDTRRVRKCVFVCVYAISKPSAALATFALYIHLHLSLARRIFSACTTHTYLGDIQFMTKLHFTAVACPILVVYIYGVLHLLIYIFGLFLALKANIFYCIDSRVRDLQFYAMALVFDKIYFLELDLRIYA